MAMLEEGMYANGWRSFLNDCMFWLCNDGITSLGGRFSLVVAVEGQLRLRMLIELCVL